MEDKPNEQQSHVRLPQFLKDWRGALIIFAIGLCVSAFIELTSVRSALWRGVNVDGTIVQSNFLYGYFLILALPLNLGIAGCWYLLFVKKVRVERIFLVASLTFGIALMFTNTYHADYDEYYHAKMTQYYTSILFGAEHRSYVEEDTGLRIVVWQNRTEDAPIGFTDSPSLYTYYHMWNNLLQLEKQPGASYEESTSVVASSSVYMYVPKIIGTALARILHLGQVPTLYLAKLFDLLFYIAIIYLVLRIIPQRFKHFFMLCALVPHALLTAGLFSYDTIPITLGFALAGYTLYLFDQKPIRPRQFIPLLVIGFFLAPAKLIYYPLLLLPLIIPTSNFASKRQKLLVCLLLLVTGAAAISLTVMSDVVSSYDSANSPDGGQSLYTLGVILDNKTEALRIYATSFVNNLGQFFESTARGDSHQGPSIVKYGVFLLLVLSLSSYRGEGVVAFSAKRRIFVAVLLLVVYGALLAVALTWTPYGDSEIWGFSSRYLTPLLPLTALLFCPPFDRRYLKNETLVFVELILSSYMVIYLFQIFVNW